MCSGVCTKRYYTDEGDRKIEEYRPTGFRWLTNSGWVDRGVLKENTVKLIQKCREVYGDVSLADAFACDGERLDWFVSKSVSIYVKKVIPIKVGGITCHSCDDNFSKKDTVRIRSKVHKSFLHNGIVICLNCFHVYSYEKLPDGSYVSKSELVR